MRPSQAARAALAASSAARTVVERPENTAGGLRRRGRSGWRDGSVVLRRGSGADRWPRSGRAARPDACRCGAPRRTPAAPPRSRFATKAAALTSPTAPRRRLLVPLVLVALVAAALVAVLALRGPAAALEYEGPDDEVVNAAALEQLAFVVRTDDPAALAGATVTHGDTDVTDQASTEGETLRWAPDGLDDGTHEVTVTLPEAGRDVTHTWAFEVAATPPSLTVTDPAGGVLVGDREPALAGESEPGATVSVDGRTVEVGDDGRFEVVLDAVPEEAVTIVAEDAHGNRTTEELTFVTVPSRVAVDEVRGLHVTGHVWRHDGMREAILEFAEDGRINTIQLDIKDEHGAIHNRTEVPLANEVGASFELYDLADVVAELHAMDVHVVGRIVAFRDDRLGRYKVEQEGDTDWVIHRNDEPYEHPGYGYFASFAHPEVLDYNLDIAEEAVRAGVDGILWDYIRRPDGPAEEYWVPGLGEDADAETMEEAIVAFTRLADERLAPYDIDHGASLYGIAADRPTQIAQDVPAMAPYLDYVAPMIYPSHWANGEYGVADPNRQPYDIITATLEVWQETVEGTDTRIVPWLEDTAYRAWDRPHQVREQIRATLDQGIDEWLMWDPNVRYTPQAYDPRDD
ncbi:hypothetical protein FTX61_13140 [Nitriliruptoraceae bacterium ZYF776]|nr:hypothetical protein [Profundirhabdus halotolerans]